MIIIVTNTSITLLPFVVFVVVVVVAILVTLLLAMVLLLLVVVAILVAVPGLGDMFEGNSGSGSSFNPSLYETTVILIA